MNLDRAQQLAETALDQHGLRNAGWAFAFDNASRRLGSCQYAKQRITLSRKLTALNDEAQVRDTILHEIAHALTPGHKHGPVWRQKAREIGARPQACVSSKDVVSPPPPFSFECPECGQRIPRYKRPNPRRSFMCRDCHGAWKAGRAHKPAPLRVIEHRIRER